jgi:hypothetical protein
MHGHELALPLAGQFREFETISGKRAQKVVRIGLAFGRSLHVEHMRKEGRHLQSLEAEIRRPFAEPVEGGKTGIGIDELRDEKRGTSDGTHGRTP